MKVPKEIVKNYLVSRFGVYYFEMRIPSYISDVKQIFKAGYRAGVKSINTPTHETVEQWLGHSKRMVAFNHDDNKKEVTIVHATELRDGTYRYMDVDGNYYSFVESTKGKPKL